MKRIILLALMLMVGFGFSYGASLRLDNSHYKALEELRKCSVRLLLDNSKNGKVAWRKVLDEKLLGLLMFENPGKFGDIYKIYTSGLEKLIPELNKAEGLLAQAKNGSLDSKQSSGLFTLAKDLSVLAPALNKKSVEKFEKCLSNESALFTFRDLLEIDKLNISKKSIKEYDSMKTEQRLHRK